MGSARLAENRDRLTGGALGEIQVVAGVFGVSWPARRAMTWQATEYGGTLAGMGRGCARAPSRQRG